MKLTALFDYDKGEDRRVEGSGHYWEGKRCRWCQALSHWPLAKSPCGGKKDPNMRTPGFASERHAQLERAKLIRQLREDGKTVHQLAVIFNLTTKTVRRILDRSRLKK